MNEGVGRARVTTSREAIVLRDARYAAPMLSGTTEGGPRSIALDGAARVEVRRVDGVGTTGMVLAGVAGAVLTAGLILAVALANCNCGG